ncbi:MAG TPA: hypothetical protein V6D06_14845 [Trichocoleus sp.]
MTTPNETTYNGDRIPEVQQQLTPEQQLQLLDTHPLFTGRCPNCEMTLLEPQLSSGRWECSCGWSWADSDASEK